MSSLLVTYKWVIFKMSELNHVEIDAMVIIQSLQNTKKLQFGYVLGLLFILEIINMTRSSILVCQDFGFLPSSSRSFLHQLLFSLLHFLFSSTSSLEQSGVGVLLLLPLLWKERQSKVENISIQIYIVYSCIFCSSSFCLLLLENLIIVLFYKIYFSNSATNIFPLLLPFYVHIRISY